MFLFLYFEIFSGILSTYGEVIVCIFIRFSLWFRGISFCVSAVHIDEGSSVTTIFKDHGGPADNSEASS